MKIRPISRTVSLTAVYGADAERQHAMTVSGMAFFSATGPFGCICKDCRFYGQVYQRIHNAAGEMLRTQRKPHACAKYQELMGGKVGGDVPEHTEACRFFEQRGS